MANLGKVVITPKGIYNVSTTYVKLDCVLYNGSSWLALKSVTGVAPIEGENWTLMAQGMSNDLIDNVVTFSDATADAILTSGSKLSTLIGLIKYKLSNIITLIAGKIDKTSIANTDTVNDTTKVLGANVGYTLGQEIDDISNNLTSLMQKDAISIGWLDQVRRSGIYSPVNKVYTPDNTQEFIFQAISPSEGAWVIWLTAYQLYADHVYIASMQTTNGTNYTVGTWHQLF